MAASYQIKKEMKKCFRLFYIVHSYNSLFICVLCKISWLECIYKYKANRNIYITQHQTMNSIYTTRTACISFDSKREEKKMKNPTLFPVILLIATPQRNIKKMKNQLWDKHKWRDGICNNIVYSILKLYIYMMDTYFSFALWFVG